MTKKGLLKNLKNYTCLFCGNKFSQIVSYSRGQTDSAMGMVKGKKGCISDQVKCPKCTNFIPTWRTWKDSEGKKLREKRI